MDAKPLAASFRVIVFYDFWVGESHHFKQGRTENLAYPSHLQAHRFLIQSPSYGVVHPLPSLYQWVLSQDSVKTPSREAAMPGLDGAAQPSPLANTWDKQH